MNLVYNSCGNKHIGNEAVAKLNEFATALGALEK